MEEELKGKTPPTVEELQKMVFVAANKVKQLDEIIKAQQRQIATKRLDYIFKVLEFSKYFDDGFLKSLVVEIQESLTPIPEEEESKDGQTE